MVGSHPVATNLDIGFDVHPDAGHGQVAGVRADVGTRGRVKRLLRPAARAWTWWLCDGFVLRRMGAMIVERATPDTVFLDVGCGNMPLRGYLPRGVCYNAIDIAFSVRDVDVVMREGRPVNLAAVSAHDIPVASETVTLLACNQVLHQVPDPGRMLAECRRVCRRDGAMLISIHNAHCRKYAAIGPHPDTINAWTFDEFKQLAADQGLRCVHGEMLGRWVPVPRSLARGRSYHLPLRSDAVEDNTHFFYVFRRA